MRNTKKTTARKSGFGLVGLNWDFKIEPDTWPKLEIHATALWFGDTFPTPNPDILTAEIVKAIERGYKARSEAIK
jgi:hypothetical protein